MTESGESGERARDGADARRPWGVPVVLLYAAAFLPLFYLPGTFYPFITGRTVAFRALVALVVAAIGWLGLRRRAWRTVDWGDPVLWGLAAYVGILLLSSLFGPSPRRSLFGSLERMTGWLGWLFWSAFYLVLRLVLRDREWDRMLRLSLAATAAAAVFGLLQAFGVRPPLLERYLFAIEWTAGKPIATLGNPGYLSVYLMLGVGLAALVFVRARTTGWRAVAALCGALDLWVLWLAESQSALLGLAAAGLVGAAVYGAARLSSRARLSAAGVGILVAVLGAGWLFQEMAAGERREGAGLTVPGLESEGVRERRLAWEAAADGVRERPLLGAGADNFQLVFDRHFDPWIHRYDPDEVWMDRAHNAFLHPFAVGGVPGGLAYLAVWIGLAWLLWRGYRSGRLRRDEAAVLSGVFASYAVFLFFWFEDPNAYPLFLVVAGFAAGRARSGAGSGGAATAPEGAGSEGAARARAELDPEGGGPARAVLEGPAGGSPAAWVGAAAATAFAALTLWHGGRLLGAAHRFHAARAESSATARATGYLSVVEDRPPGTRELLTETASFLVGLRGRRDELAERPAVARVVQQSVQRTMDLLRAEARRDPENPRLQAARSGLYRTAFELSGQEELYRLAVRTLERAVERAPSRLGYRRSLAELHLSAGNPEVAKAAVEEAIGVYARSPELQLQAARVELALGDPLSAYGRLRLAHMHGLEPPEGRRTALAVARRLAAEGRGQQLQWLVETYGFEVQREG